MKNIIYGVVMAAIGVLIVLVLLTINGKMTRQAEIDDSLASAVENSLDNCLNKKNYTIENDKEFVADFNQELLTQIENDADIEINITKVDANKGIIGIKVIEVFNNPNSKESKQEYETTAILDAWKYYGYFIVTFKDKDNSIISQNRVRGDTKVIAPTMPNNFDYWLNEQTGEQVRNFENFGNVFDNLTFKAVYK